MERGNGGQVQRLGESFGYVQEDHSRIEDATRKAEREGQHLWMVIATYHLSRHEARDVGESKTVMLDADHLLDVSGVGCFVCEQTYEHAHGKKCKGQPVSYAPSGAPIYADGSGP